MFLPFPFCHHSPNNTVERLHAITYTSSVLFNYIYVATHDSWPQCRVVWQHMAVSKVFLSQIPVSTFPSKVTWHIPPSFSRLQREPLTPCPAIPTVLRLFPMAGKESGLGRAYQNVSNTGEKILVLGQTFSFLTYRIYLHGRK